MTNEALPEEWNNAEPVAVPPADDIIARWEKATPIDWKPGHFIPTRRNWAAMRESFAGDPLAFVLDPKLRADFEFVTAREKDPELTRKKLALANYYANMRRERVLFAYDNLDSFIKQFHGKELSADAAYNEVAKLLTPQQSMAEGGEYWKSVGKAGGAKVAKSVTNAGWSLLKQFMIGAEMQALADPLAPKSYEAAQEAMNRIGNVEKVIEKQRGESVGYYEDVAQENTAAILKDDWFTSSEGIADWCTNAFTAVLVEAPNMGAQVALSIAAPQAAPFLLGGIYANDKYFDLSDEHPEMSDSDKAINAALTGVINGALDKISVGILTGKGVKPELVKQGMAKAIRYGLTSIGKEGGVEAAQQLAENSVDIMTGVYGDFNKLSWEERGKLLLKGVPESFFVGAVYGAPYAGIGYMNARQRERLRVDGQAFLEQRRAEIMAKETVTQQDLVELQECNNLLEAANPDAVIRLGAAVNFNEQLQPQAEIADPDQEMSVEELAQQAEQQYWIRTKALVHNPADTADRVRELAALYPGVNTEVVDDPAMFSDAAKAEAARREIALDNVRGFYDPATNTMVVNAAKVRPSEVPALALHEIVGHAGLKQVLGNTYDQMLDSVIRDHRDDLGTIPLRYNLDLDTVKGQREAAEEYIAHIAEGNPDLKPSWWREFLQQIKMLLRRVPGLENLRYTDREIEAMLARSARAMRRSSKVPPPDARANALRGRADREAETRFALRDFPEEAQRLEAGRLKIFTDNYRQILEEFDAGTLPRDRQIELGETPDALTMLGVEQLPVSMSGSLLYKAREKHGLTTAELKQIPEALYNPVMIFDSSDRSTNFESGMVVLTQIRDKDGKPVIIALNLGKGSKRHQVNDIASIHGRRVKNIVDWIDEGFLRYSHKKRALAFARFHRLQLPKKATLSERNSDIIIDESPNVKPENEKTNDSGNGIRFSIAPVWTGSAADYDRPSLHYIGTGEGAQAYGWGLYGSSSENVARWYARTDAERKNRARILLDGKEPDPDWLDRADLSGEPTEFEIENTVLEDVRGRRGSISGTLEYYRIQMSKPTTRRESPEFYRLCREWLEKNKDRIQYIPEQEETTGRRNVYKQTFWTGKEENLLDWNENIPPEQAQNILDALRREYDDFNSPDGANLISRLSMAMPGEISEAEAAMLEIPAGKREPHPFPGEEVYQALTDFLGSPKAASEFLYRAGVSGITFIGGSSGVRNYVAFSDQDIRVDEHLRFSVSEYSDQDMETFATILRPFVGLAMDKTDAEYLAYLQEKNLPVHSEEWAHAFAAMAEQMNQEAQTRADKEKKFNWLYENIPFYRYAVDAAGTRDFKIVPSHRFAGEEFSGTFIADAWRKFSGKEKAEGKTGARRKKKLEEAAGVRSDALAETIARDIGGDAIQIENDLIDFFRDLDKRKLGSKYSDYRKESAFRDKEQEREARQEFEALRREEERNRIEEEVYSILTEGREITEEYRKAEPEVVKLVRDRLLGEQAKQYTNQQELEAINAAIRQEAGNAATNAQAYRDARERTWQEYNERYRQLRDRVMESKADALKLQREAAAFAEKYLPPEARGEFSRRIIGLLEYSTLPNKKYPEGRRKAEFDRLQQDILNRSGEVSKTKLLGEIKELLDANKTRRNYKGIPTSAAPATQQQIDRIRFIASMNLPAAAAAIEANNTRIAELEEAGDAETAIADLRLDNTLLSTFAGLDERPVEAVREARQLLGSVVLHGRAILKEQLAARQERLRRMRADVIADLTDGGMEVQGNKDGNQHAAYPLRLNSISGTLKLLSGRSIEDLANTVSGGFLRRIEDASWNESTEIRRVDDALMQAYRDIAKTENVFQRAKFIRKVYTEVEHSGVFRNVYAQTREIAKNRYILRVGKRELLRRNIPVEQARDLLRRIDAGEKVELYQDIPLTEAGLHFLRLQLADYDAGLKPAYEIFGDEQDDAQFNRMLESEAKNANLQLFAPDQGEAPPVRQEEKLSPGAALQILLTWEQPHYRPGMEWNGWTEESMEQIRKFIGPEVLQFGYWMRDFIRSRQKQLDRAVYERYGAHLPENPNYFPASFRESVKSKVKEERGGMGRGVGTMSVNPNFLIARKFHLKPVDTSVNAFEVFLNNQLETIHFLNWSETVRDLRSVYSNRDVQEAIDNQLGRNVKAKLFEGINALAQNGVPGGDAGVKAINKLIRLWVPSNIAINPGSWIKQMLGAIAYSNNMPLTEWAKYSSRAAFWNADFREFAELAGNSDYMKNRMHGSLNKELQFMLSRSRSTEHYNPLLDSMMEYATWGTRATDYWASIHGGYAIYAYNRDKALAAGRSAAEATAIGLRQWQRATDQTQQSAYIKDQNSYQLNQGLYRFLTVYQSNPMQILGLQLDNLNRLRYGDKKAARKELAKMIFINHLVIPPLMLAVNEILRNGFDFEEWDWEDFFIAAAFGNLSSAFLWGQFLFNASNAAADKLLHRPMWRTSDYSALPMLDDATNSLTQLIGLVDKDEITEKDMLSSMQSIGNLMMTTAPFPGAAGAISKAGAVMKFTTTQAKRIYNLFAEK